MIKKILAPTDFSAPAYNASVYAAALAKQLKAKLTLLNCYHLPLTTAETPLPLVTIEALQESSMNELRELRKELLGEFPGLEIQVSSSAGFAVEEISGFAAQHHIDMVVMGITGAGKLSERVVGSTAVSAIMQLKCPVLIIPIEAVFKSTSKLGLACDMKQVMHPSAFDVIRELLKSFGSGLEVLNVIKPGEGVSFEKAVAGVSLENSLGDVPHRLYFPEDNDIVQGIRDFVERHHLDVITLVKRPHSLLYKLLHESNNKRMAFHTRIPLLALHE